MVRAERNAFGAPPHALTLRGNALLNTLIVTLLRIRQVQVACLGLLERARSGGLIGGSSLLFAALTSTLANLAAAT